MLMQNLLFLTFGFMMQKINPRKGGLRVQDLGHSAEEIASLFAIPSLPTDVRSFGNGHINDTFLIRTPERDYVLQRISPQAFPHPEHIMENMALVTSHLRSAIASRGGDPYRESLCVVPLKTGETYYKDKDHHVWRMTVCIPGVKSLDLPESPAIFLESGRAFGMFARDLDGFPAASLHETIAHFHDTPRRLDALRNAVRSDACNRKAQSEDLIALYLDRACHAGDLVNQLNAGTLPLRVTHNDTKLNNVLLDEKTGHAVCVIDLDTVMPGLVAYDFGDAIRFGANTAAEDEADKSKIHFSLPMFQAFAEGYLYECSNMLTENEIDSLPLGAWMMTYECGMRFLTDYLSGDTYFHTAYPAHNLVRAWNQITLLMDMEPYMPQMQNVVQLAAKKGRST